MSNEANTERHGNKYLFLLPIILVAVVHLSSVTNRGVLDYDEGYYVQPALQMLKHGDWVTPYANGVRFLEKPPLLYWITAASFKIFGINEFALRLPTAVAVIALVWIMMLIARTLADDRAAIIAGLSTGLSIGTYLFTRETLHDVWMVLFIALAVYAFVKWHQDPFHSLKHALLFYAATAGAVMCKSLVGIAFPAGILAVFFLISREWPHWRKFHLLPGSVLFLALTVPWHWLAAIRNEGFFNFFFVGEQFLRFFGKREPPVVWSVPLLTFWLLILVWLFPWTAFLPATWTASRKSEDPSRRMLVKLAIAWAAVILTFFSVSGRLEHYIFPALPAFSLLIASALSQDCESKSIGWAFRALAILGTVILIIGIGAGMWIVTGHGIPFAGTGPRDRILETDFSILAEMPETVIFNLLEPAAITVIAMAIGFGISFWFDIRGKRMSAIVGLAAVMMLVCGTIHWSLIICEDLISSKKFGLAIAREARASDRLIVMDDYESANSLSFYQSLPVEIFGGTAYALIPGMKYPDAPQIVLSPKEFESAWRSTSRTFVLLPRARLAELNPGGIEVLSLLHRVLVRNR